MLFRLMWGRRLFGSLPKHTVVSLPALSPTMTQGTIASWRRQPGEQVRYGDVLADIETDKAQMEFETPEEGFVAKILLPPGSKDIAVSTVLFPCIC
jgi:pyruvate dehydrogenase E2 component (dihydrolipoamide acetyltransferase)